MLKIKEVKSKCSICGKYFTTKILPNGIYKGGNCFRSLDPKNKSENWECDKCWGTELVQLHPHKFSFESIFKS